tara:strand:+ start:2238 stop:2747 length:510 start_codon:yes stop_codon:yes gene_type:complete
MGRVTTRSMMKGAKKSKKKKGRQPIITSSSKKKSPRRRRENSNIELLILLWVKCSVIQGLDPNEWRTDNYGNRIRWSEYGNRGCGSGWEIDHIKPVSRGGSNDLRNLQALQWRENLIKGNKYPYYPMQNIQETQEFEEETFTMPRKRTRRTITPFNIGHFHSRKTPLRF